MHPPTEAQSETDAAPIGPVILIAMFVTLAAVSGLSESVTSDEPSHLGVGAQLLRTGQWSTWNSRLHPPLFLYLSALPSMAPAWLADKLDPLASGRLAMLLSGVALAALVYRWAKTLYGRAAGLAALTLTAFSPNLLAHAPLITPDVTLTCTVFASAFAMWAYGRRPSATSALVAGLAIGLSLASKFTALLLLPVWALAVVAGGWRVRRAKTAADLLIVGFAAWLVLNAAYQFRNTGRAFDVNWLESDRLKAWLFPALTRLAPHPFWGGVDFQLARAAEGQWGFLMGEQSNEGWPQYFLVAFLIKTPIALQALLVAALVLCRRRLAGPTAAEPGDAAARPPSRASTALCLAAPPLVIFGYMSLFCRIDIGFRYVLPMLPFLHVAAGRLVALPYRRPRRAAGLLLLALILYVAESTAVFPHYLAFFNAWIGGPRNGYKYLVDSNLDWGQDAARAQAYVARHAPDVVPVRNGCVVHGRVVIGATALQGLTPLARADRAWLRAFEPIGNIGYSVLIFDVPVDAVPHDLRGARGYVYRGRFCLQTGHVERAMAEFRRAIACAPDYPPAHIGLANCYLVARQPQRAREVLSRAPDHPAVKALLRKLMAGP